MTPAKKRNRITKVCDFCRKRKVKCDLGNPCSSCVKYKQAVCSYGEGEVDGGVIHDQLRYLKEKVRLLETTMKPLRDSQVQFTVGNEYDQYGAQGGHNGGSSDGIRGMSHVKEEVSGGNHGVKRANTAIDGGGSSGGHQGAFHSTFPGNIHGSGGSIVAGGSINPSGSIHANGTGNLSRSISTNTIRSNSSDTSSIGSSSIQPNTIDTTTIHTNTFHTNIHTNIHTNAMHANTHTNAIHTNTHINTHTNRNHIPPNVNPYRKEYPLDPNSRLPPFGGPLDSINFCDGYSSIMDREPIRRRHSSPLTWVSLIKADTALSKLWEHLRSRNIKKSKGDPLEAEFNNPESESFKERVTADEGYNDVRLYKDQVPNPKPKFNLETRAKSLGLSFYQGGLDAELELIEKIRLVLPKQKAVWLLIKRFFTHIYIQLPFVDEKRFKEQIQVLIGPEGYEDVPLAFVKAEKRLDFSILGLLLLVIRLGYLSLFTSVSLLIEDGLDPNEERSKIIGYLLDNPVNIDVINVAQLCLDQFNLTRGINIAIMQLALYTRIYHMFAPEDGDGTDGGDSMVMNSMLIQMARSLGLHREPDLFAENCNDAKTNNIGRKIWYYLIILDYNRSLHDGSCCNIHPGTFDTKLPYCTPENANLEDYEREEIACNAFRSFNDVMEPMHKLISLVSTVKGNVNIAELHEVMGSMEKLYEKSFGKYLTQIYDTDLSLKELHTRALGMRIYFTLNFVAVSIYFHFFNYYERRRNTEAAYYYIKNIIVRSVCDLMPFYFAFLDRSNIIFRNFTDLLVTPGFEQIIHKSLLVLSSICIRVNLSIVQQRLHVEHNSKMESDLKYRVHFGKLEAFLVVLKKALEVFRGLIDRLSYRYYYAWRVSKAHNFICEFLRKSNFFESYKDAIDYSEFEFSSEMIDELIKLIQSSLSKITHIKKLRNFDEDIKIDVNSRCILNVDTSPINESVSSGSDIVDSKPSEEIDRMWMQLLNNKKVLDTNNWSNTLNFSDGNANVGVNNGTRYQDFGDNSYGTGYQYSNFGVDNMDMDPFQGLGFQGTEVGDLFAGIPFEEMFREPN